LNPIADDFRHGSIQIPRVNAHSERDFPVNIRRHEVRQSPSLARHGFEPKQIVKTIKEVLAQLDTQPKPPKGTAPWVVTWIEDAMGCHIVVVWVVPSAKKLVIGFPEDLPEDESSKPIHDGVQRLLERIAVELPVAGNA
jgi:hypothetical protein